MHACKCMCAHARTCAYLIFPVNNRLDTFTLVCHYAVSGLAQSAHIKSTFGARKHGNDSGFISRPRVCLALIYEISPYKCGHARIYAGFNAMPMAVSVHSNTILLSRSFAKCNLHRSGDNIQKHLSFSFDIYA